MSQCPATSEAVLEHEREGDSGCPLCGRPSSEHRREGNREDLVCPFCLTRFAVDPPQMCGGSFLDRDHPSAVRPILVELAKDGTPAESEEPRLREARETYKR